MIRLSASRCVGSPQQRIPAVVLIAVLGVGIWVGGALVQAYDPRLNEALAALQKAAALVEASSAGDVSARTQHKFDSDLGKALASIQDAMDHIVAAGTAADSDGGSQ
jgi:hypothetical protein